MKMGHSLRLANAPSAFKSAASGKGYWSACFLANTWAVSATPFGVASIGGIVDTALSFGAGNPGDSTTCLWVFATTTTAGSDVELEVTGYSPPIYENIVDSAFSGLKLDC